MEAPPPLCHPTGAYPDFLPRNVPDSHVCGFPPKKATGSQEARKLTNATKLYRQSGVAQWSDCCSLNATARSVFGSKVVEILKHGNPDSQAMVLPLLAALPSDSPWAKQPEVSRGLRALLGQQLRSANYRVPSQVLPVGKPSGGAECGFFV